MNKEDTSQSEALRSNRSNAAMGLLLLFFLAVFIGLTVVVNLLASRDEQYLEHAGELRVLSQELAKNAVEAASGKQEAFIELRDARDKFTAHWGHLTQGHGNIGPAKLDIMPEVQLLWGQVKNNTDRILSSQDVVLSLQQVANRLAHTIPELQTEYEAVLELLLSGPIAASQIAQAQRQPWLAERILRSVGQVLKGQEPAAAEAFLRDTLLFGQVLNGMIQGDELLKIQRVTHPQAALILANIAQRFAVISGSVDEILATESELYQVRAASEFIITASQTLLNHTSTLSKQVQAQATLRYILQAGSYIAAALALLTLFVYGGATYRRTQRDLRATAQQNEQSQAAILRLLNEIADLAHGDLTTTATVTEDFTGAIADSINYAVDQLRTLVSAINDTALQVSSAADETQKTAVSLAVASENQAHEITEASSSINSIAQSIDQVSANASQSSAVAERSVTIANKGSQVVQASIQGMDKIREQIQDTSKRLKRLGESSQEIGDIISLITDIADQTNILALNAAIQASMAGDAGRGFAVVADEVQRLAERSSDATRQIEGLVKTIQNDTGAAVMSMEQTTAEVVRGGQLAQNAGVALEEIESVSANLAGLIQGISDEANEQANSARKMSATMNVIQDFTRQTSEGTSASAHSIALLAEMSNKLRDSVAGFKLPERPTKEQA